MNISYLREFITLAKELNFSTAAKKLFITQPVLSRHISFIEEQLDVTLFTRNYHSVELTDMGKLFLENITDVVARYDATVEAIERASSSENSRLKVGFLDTAFRSIVAKSLETFFQTKPNVNLLARPYEYGELLDCIDSNEIDVALTHDFQFPIMQNYNMEILAQDHLCAVVKSDHPFAKFESIEISVLKRERLLLPTPKEFAGFHEYQVRLLTAASVDVNKTSMYPHINAALLMSQSRQGIALLPSHLIANASSDLTFVPISDKEWTYDIVALWKKTNDNKNISAFLKALKAAM